MSETGDIRQLESQTTRNAMNAGRFLVQAATELQRWSGHLDWSKRLAAEGTLKTLALIDAFSRVSRADFLPAHQKADEGFDEALQIGYEQANSQPSLVAEMLELLNPEKGQAVLDVGSGSGWTTTLLAAAVGENGRVVGTERVPELVEAGQANLSPYGFSWAKIEHTPSGLGFATEAPYDRILVSAHMLEEWVPELSSQLSGEGGIMLAPIVAAANHGTDRFDQNIMAITRNGDEFTSEIVIKGVGFVPLIREQASLSAEP